MRLFIYIVVMRILTLCPLITTYNLLLIFYLFYTMERMLGKKQIEWFFFFKLKMGPKATETTLQINKAFDPELVMDMWHSGSPATLQKRWGPSTAWWEATGSWPWPTKSNHEGWSREAAKELHTVQSVFIRHLKLIGKVKRLIKWMISWAYQSQSLRNKMSPWTALLFHSMSQQQTNSWLSHAIYRQVVYDRKEWPTQWPSLP